MGYVRRVAYTYVSAYVRMHACTVIAVFIAAHQSHAEKEEERWAECHPTSDGETSDLLNAVLLGDAKIYENYIRFVNTYAYYDSDCQTGFSSASHLRSWKQANSKRGITAESRHGHLTAAAGAYFGEGSSTGDCLAARAPPGVGLSIKAEFGFLFPLPRFSNMIGEGFLKVKKSLHSLMWNLI